jgi:hypothetical protein
LGDVCHGIRLGSSRGRGLAALLRYEIFTPFGRRNNLAGTLAGCRK